MKLLYLILTVFSILLIAGCTNKSEIENTNDKERFEQVREVAWAFVEEKGWNETAEENWQNAKVKKEIANNSYELLDKTYEGKEVLSVFDTLTVDGEGINKYDFFDSDDIEKSISGVIAKNVANLLPLFTPIGGVYSTILIAKEFAKAMPMLYGFATMLSD